MEEQKFLKRAPTMLCRQVTKHPGEEVDISGTGRKQFVPEDWWIIVNEQTGHVDSMPPHQFSQVYRPAPLTREEIIALVIDIVDDELRKLS